MDLTLNDFRNVLGNKNDGDVVMRLDQKGLEKANWGGLLRSVLGNVRKVTPSAEENMAIRASLMAAIQNSAEGKVLSDADLQRIESAMGSAADGVWKFSSAVTPKGGGPWNRTLLRVDARP